ncbi:DUF6404 family protein [Photobacterium alginatilyticum]|uniref:DUF6404 family protein n=1 Tax=Photobacterium alginatilyticum TaxID=1775171 RepID=UPI0040689D85
MEKDEFVQVYLISLGATIDEVKPFPALFYKLTGKKGKPRLFESPMKLFWLETVLGTLSWGFFMWLFVWQFIGLDIIQLYAALFFGITTGAILAIKVKRKAKRLKLYQWDKWLKDKKFT